MMAVLMDCHFFILGGDFMLKKAFVQLLKIKSLVTIITTAVFAYLSITGKILPENFMEIFKLVVIFYFGSQVGKREAQEEAEEAKEEEDKEKE